MEIIGYRIWIKFICKNCGIEIEFIDGFAAKCGCGRKFKLKIEEKNKEKK